MSTSAMQNMQLNGRPANQVFSDMFANMPMVNGQNAMLQSSPELQQLASRIGYQTPGQGAQPSQPGTQATPFQAWINQPMTQQTPNYSLLADANYQQGQKNIPTAGMKSYYK